MPDGYLTTHVLDTARGVPAEGLRVTLYRLSGAERTELISVATNSDGRADAPILKGDDFVAGEYELVFRAGDYLRKCGQVGAGIAFLDEIPIRFGIADTAAHCHVPLLLSPYGYSTYRGS